MPESITVDVTEVEMITVDITAVEVITIDTGSVGASSPSDPPGDDLTTHVQDTTPHPAYDDLPSLVLLFENGLI